MEESHLSKYDVLIKYNLVQFHVIVNSLIIVDVMLFDNPKILLALTLTR